MTEGTLEAAGAHLGAARDELRAYMDEQDWRQASATAKVLDRVETALDELAYVAQIPVTT